MAVYTDVSFEDLETFLERYGIGAPLSFKGIAEGVENSNFFLRTEEGAFILTLYEKRVQADDLPFFLGLMEHLSAHGIACPLPVRQRGGELFSELNGRPAALLTFLNGVSLRHPDADRCAAAGAALAALHEAGNGFTLQRPNALGPAGWRDLAAKVAEGAAGVEEGLGGLIRTALELPWPSGLPSGIIHADLFPDNVLFMNGQVSGVIDFYFACNDAFAYDLAVLLNAWCFDADGGFDVARSAKLFAAYRKHRALGAGEIEALPALARGAALRFLLTRLYDILHHDPMALVRPKDPLEYLKKLRFHRSVTDPAAYGIDP